MAGRRQWIRRLVIAASVATVSIGLAFALHPFAIGLSLVVRAADLRGLARRAADLTTVSVSERLLYVPIHDVPTRARAYIPIRRSRQTVLLVSGLHPDGIDEPRLVYLSRELAKSNVTVVTPEIPELSRFEITPALTDRIEQIAVWLARYSGFAHSGRIGLMGISFSGGLSIVAAGRPSLRTRLLYVFSLGGHDDLPRVLGFYCAGASTSLSPHDYGLAIVLLNVADQVVPPEQVALLRDAVRRFLWASYVDRSDRTLAAREFTALRDLAVTFPEPSATLLGYVNDRDIVQLGRRLQPFLKSYAEAPALSPARSPVPTAPVFLLHGMGDTVIPATESQCLVDRLGPARVRLLFTHLISHADADQPARVIEVAKVAAFWGDLLSR